MEEDNDPPIRKSVTLRASVWRAISQFKLKEKASTDAEAHRLLLQIALAAVNKKK